MKSRLTTLSSGLRVATCEMPHAGTAAVGIWAGVGGRHEPARLNGISHFIEHMVFKGTARRSARRIMEEVEGVGGDLNAYTAEERTCYYAAAAAEYFPRLLDVLGDIYLEPRFAATDIERERSVIGEEILMYRDEPSSHVQELLNERFWPGHALGRPLTGTLKTIETLRAEDFRAYRSTHYHAGTTVVTAAGRVDHDDVVRRAEKLFGGLRMGRAIRATKAPAFARAPRIVAEKRDVQQTQISLGLPGPGAHDARRHAFQILQIILGGNGSSRLFQQLRERRGLCYSISAHPILFQDTGMLNISMGLDQRNVTKSLRLILTAMADLRDRPVRRAELERAKEYAIGASRMSLERTSNQNMRLGGSVLVYGTIIEPEDVHARLRAVTAEEIQDAARDFLVPRRATVAVIGAAPDARALKEILEG